MCKPGVTKCLLDDFIFSYQKMRRISPRVDFIKLCAPSEKTPAHSVRQKICRSISPTMETKNFRLKCLQNLPNLCALCQIFSPFATRCVPKKASHPKRNRPQVYVDNCDVQQPKRQQYYRNNFFRFDEHVNDDVFFSLIPHRIIGSPDHQIIGSHLAGNETKNIVSTNFRTQGHSKRDTFLTDLPPNPPADPGVM